MTSYHTAGNKGKRQAVARSRWGAERVVAEEARAGPGPL